MREAWITALILLTGCAVWSIWFCLTSPPQQRRRWSGADFTPLAGFAILQLPCGAAPHQSWLIDGSIAQLDYSFGRTAAFFCAAVNTGREISRQTQGRYTLCRRTALQGASVLLYQTPRGRQLALWQQGGFCFSLYLPHATPARLEELLPRFLPVRCTLTG